MRNYRFYATECSVLEISRSRALRTNDLWHAVRMHIFISHNNQDKDFVRKLAAQLGPVGGDVWLDGWKIKPGDRMASEVSAALAIVDTAVVIFSAKRWNEAGGKLVGVRIGCMHVERIGATIAAESAVCRYQASR